jgi:hypothetical protein
MSWIRDRAGRRRMWILGMEVVVFTLLVLWFANASFDAGGDTSERQRIVKVLVTTIGVLAGPMNGAISREDQPSCLDFSLSLLLPCGAILAAGILLQFVPARSRLVAGFLLPAAWALGWLAWFGGAVLSLLQALE